MNEKLLKALDTINASIKDDATKDEVVGELKNRFGTHVKEPMTVESVEAFLSKDEKGKKLVEKAIDSKKESIISEHLKSEDFLKKQQAEIDKVKADVEETIRKEMNKELTPEQKRIKALEEKDKLNEQRFQKQKLESVAKEYLADKKLSKEFLQFVVNGENEAAIKNTIDGLATTLNEAIAKGVKEEFKKVGRTPPKGEETAPTITQKMIDDLGAKAKASGKLEDRVQYARMKAEFKKQQNAKK